MSAAIGAVIIANVYVAALIVLRRDQDAALALAIVWICMSMFFISIRTRR